MRPLTALDGIREIPREPIVVDRGQVTGNYGKIDQDPDNPSKCLLTALLTIRIKVGIKSKS